MDAFREIASGNGSDGGESVLREVDACDASESASEYIPFRTHVSMRTGTSNKSLSLSCCSRTTRALVRSPSTSGPLLSLNSLAAPSSAGKDPSIRDSREEDRDANDDRNELVVVCKERNVG